MDSTRLDRLLGTGVFVVIGLTGICATDASAEDAATTRPSATRPADLMTRIDAAITRGLAFQARHQNDDGGWTGPFEKSDPAISALVVQGFIRHPAYGPRHPIVRRAMEFILGYQRDDGGVYDPDIGYQNYTTSIALMALAAMDLPEYASEIEDAQSWLKRHQWVEGRQDNEGNPITPQHVWYGGAGYGRHQRPDLSNTHMMLDALRASGLPPEDPAFQKALRFVVRCQMLDRTNDQPFADGVNDGGFIYTPAEGGVSMAGYVAADGDEIEDSASSEDAKDRHLRTYGSMTYAGFKSMIYADVDRDDIRVQRAWDWIRRNYTLDSNPNMPHQRSQQGLFYYYHVFAKALEAWGEPLLETADQQRRDWRKDLVKALLERQQADGSWVNAADRWMEGNPHLVSAYSVLALHMASNSLAEKAAKRAAPH